MRRDTETFVIWIVVKHHTIALVPQFSDFLLITTQSELINVSPDL